MTYGDKLMHRAIDALRTSLRPYKRPEPQERHLFRRLHDDKPEGPFLCSCGRVCFDAEEGLHHLSENVR